MNSTSLIWKRLLVLRKRFVTANEIMEFASELEKKGRRSVDYLQEEGYICRILRGFYYVKSYEERKSGTLELTIYEMVAKALEMKGVEKWYFSMETALKMNVMTHEYFTIDFVFTNSYRTTKVIMIMGSKFQFIRRSNKSFTEGIMEKNGIRYSDPERTILDIAYRAFLESHDRNRIRTTIDEYRNRVDCAKAKRYLEQYPPRFRKEVEDVL